MKQFESIPDILLSLNCPVSVNGKKYNTIRDWYTGQEGEFIITFNAVTDSIVKSELKIGQIQITVKEGMTKLSGLGFHKVHNNNIPMPCNVMVGTVLSEDERKKKMDLWDKNHKIHWVGWVLKSMILKEEQV